MSFWKHHPNKYYTCGCIEEYEDSTPGYGEYEYITTTWCDEHKEYKKEIKRRQQESAQRIFNLEAELKEVKKHRETLWDMEIPDRERDAQRELEEKRERLNEQREGLISRLENVKKEIEDLNP